MPRAAPLTRYAQKRNFSLTPEPPAVAGQGGKQLAFVIQKHWATRLHYDFRLELDGVLLSWAVPKGPSFDPKDKRLAVHVEDHPVAYGGFEGRIPEKQYGAGDVIVWDRGTWEPVGEPHDGLKKGKLLFRLHGEKLAGLWELVRINKPAEKQEPWLLFKKKDDYVRPAAEYDVTVALPDSVIAKPLGLLEAREVPNARDGHGPVLSSPTAAPAKAQPRTVATKPAAKKLAVKKAGAKKVAVKNAAKPAHKAASRSTAAPAGEEGGVTSTVALSDALSAAGATKAALPDSMPPQLATLSQATPQSGDWLFEIKFDGYRIAARIGRGKVKLITRGGHDWTHKMPELAREIESLGLSSAWLDGEVVVFGDDGTPDFNALQNAFDRGRSAGMRYFVFDLPYLEGHDLRELPLQTRRALLQQCLQVNTGERVRFSEDFPADAASVVKTACAMHLEGVIAKRRDAPYLSGRSKSWLKLKCSLRQEFVVVGFTEGAGGRNQNAVGSLMLGYHDDRGKLQFAGSVGTGWSLEQAVALRRRLAPLEVKKAAVDASQLGDSRWSRSGAPSRWLRPELVAEVSFGEWTPEGRVRHSVFKGLRSDKPASAITREKAQPLREGGEERGTRKMNSSTTAAATSDAGNARSSKAPISKKASKAAASTFSDDKLHSGEALAGGVKVTHAQRVIDASTGATKLDLVRYYDSVADWMLPHLKGRPVSLVRGPSGIGGELFFQKHLDKLKIVGVNELDPALWPKHDALIELPSRQALLHAAQMNVIEFHTWNSTVRHINEPDRMIFDLDPGEGVGWPQVQEAAVLMRALLTELGLRSWLKTSGGKGLHVVVPHAPKLDFDVVKAFSQAIVKHLAQTIPARFVAISGPSNRIGKIFVDYLRNGHSQTTAAAFSARARPGMGVSMPIDWDELPQMKSGAHFTIRNARDHLSLRKADPWAEYARCKQGLSKAMKALDFEAPAAN